MSAGTGLTSNVGGPFQPTPTELEATAAAQTTKAYLGIIPDSLQKPVSQIDYEGTWKYKSAANNPTIAPMIRVRTSTAKEEKEDMSWRDIFNQLLSKLPSDVREMYLEQLQLPVEERSRAFASLDNVLGLAARFIAYVNKTQLTDPALSPSEDYLALPGRMQNNLIVVGGEVIRFAQRFLEQIGHRSADFDHLSAFTASLDELLQKFQSALAVGNKDKLAEVAQQLSALQTQAKALDGVSEGSLKVLWPALAVMAMIASTASLDAGTAPLVLTMSLASIGIKTSDGRVGMLPPSIGSIVEGFTQLLATLISKPGKGSEFLPLLFTGLMFGATGLAAAGRDKPFDLGIGLILLNNSGFIDTLAAGLAHSLHLNDSSAAQAKDIFSVAAFLQFIRSLNANDASHAVEGIQDSLKALFSRISEESADHEGFSLFIQKCLVALTEDHSDEFVDIADEGLFPAEDETEKSEADIKELKKRLEGLFTLLKAVREHSNNLETGVVIA